MSPATSHRRRDRLALVVAVVLLASACGQPSVTSPSAVPPPTPGPSTAATAEPVPALGHVWVIVLENVGYDRIVGSKEAPYLNQLLAEGGLAEGYAGISTPSQPNYLAMFSGSTQGVTDNEPHDLDAPTLADQIEAAGRSWGEYAENAPGDCFAGATASGGRDGVGKYARKHAPAISFKSIRSNPARCANIRDLSSFEPGNVDYSLIVPNLCHDMHDCSITDGDAWLAGFVPRITGSTAWQAGGLLVVTFDEGEKADNGHGRIATILVSPLVAAGVTSSVPHDHYSLLRTIESGWGLGCLAASCTANTLGEFFAGS